MSSVLTPPGGKQEVAGGMRFATLMEWLAWQDRLHFSAIDLGLDRCAQVAGRMDLLAPAYAVVSIAGTNGKGSSAAMLEALLMTGGNRTGCYTSPHLLRYNERIRIGGAEVSDAMLCQSFQRIDAARGDISLTYFEFGTLAALDLFQRAEIDIAILEVGLGGRLDAVNIVDADVALICSIDLDHESWLGHDREKIGLEKAGIIRAGRPSVCADAAPPRSIPAYAEQLGARLYLAGRDFHTELAADCWTWRSNSGCYTGLPIPGRLGPEQVRNAAGVLQVMQLLGEDFPVTEADIHACLADFHLPGRFQHIPGEIEYILDVAHNTQAAGILAAGLVRLPAANTHMVIGMLQDKSHRSVCRELSEAADFWYAADLPPPRGASAEVLLRELSEFAHGASLASFADVAGALAAATRRAAPGDRIVVTGSFVTVGEALNWLEGKG